MTVLGKVLAVLLAWWALAAVAMADDLQRILETGTLRAGVCFGSEPIGFRDGDDRPSGYDIDVARQLAAALEVELELVEVTVSTRTGALLDGRIDVIVCNITATPQRARQLDFSFPYLRTGIKLLVRRDAGLDDLAGLEPGHRLLVTRDSTGEALARRVLPERELGFVERPGDAALQLQQGVADAYLEDSLIVDFIARNFPDTLAALPATYSSDAIAFGIRKGNPDFLRWLDLFASTYVSSGRYEATYGKWWGGPPPPLTPIW